jgi:hypothetical protein
MAEIETLVGDIYKLVDGGGEINDELVAAFADNLAGIVRDRMTPRKGGSYLRPSNIGEDCDRKLWYSINRPELGEALSPETKLKFLIGDLHEAILLFLAEAAGHEVSGQQDVVGIDGVSGSRDAVIDGVLTDVKSASSRSFDKFVDGLTPDTDAFGYLKQLNFYLEASKDDPKVRDKDRAAFLASDKTLGKIALDVHKRRGYNFSEIIERKREMLASDRVPSRGYAPVPEGKSGNQKLGVKCSYCPFKHSCWPGLRTFIYSYGPVYLTHVEREPRVFEANAR